MLICFRINLHLQMKVILSEWPTEWPTVKNTIIQQLKYFS